MAINMVDLDDEHEFFIRAIKKALHFHVRLIVFLIIVTTLQSLNQSTERSRRVYEQGVDENRLRHYV